MKLFRKAIRQRRLTRMRELLSAVIEQNGSENQLPEDGRIIRSWAFVILGFVLFYVFTSADIFLPAVGMGDFGRDWHFTPCFWANISVSSSHN